VAQKVEVRLVDDLDGGKADETLSFGLDGRSYEIDVSRKNAQKLRSALAPYLAGARKVSGRRPAKRAAGAAAAPKTRGRRSAPGAPASSEVREWAKKAGLDVSDRGRIPSDLVARFREAHAR
jgi:hypothetical protein